MCFCQNWMGCTRAFDSDLTSIVEKLAAVEGSHTRREVPPFEQTKAIGADIMMDMVPLIRLSFLMIRLIIRRTLTLLVLTVGAPPARAGEAYQVATISSLLAGGYDGDMTVGELLRHGDFGLGTFNGVDGEMMVLDGRVYRGTTDSRAHSVAWSERIPFAVVADFHPQGSMPVAVGQSLEQLQAALDALP